MKYIFSFVGIVLIVVGLIFCGTSKDDVSLTDDYMRIHITANSDSVTDQNLKYAVKDAVVDFLIPKLAFATSESEAEQIVFENLEQIKVVVLQILSENGVNYGADISIEREVVPARAYDDLVLDAGEYQSLKINLGDAKGGNWWCVVFPAVCFLSSKNSANYVYISKIWDIICSVIG